LLKISTTDEHWKQFPLWKLILRISGLGDSLDYIAGDLKGEFYEIAEHGTRFAVYHRTKSKRKNPLIQFGNYDVVICGHTHKLENLKV
jgi:predicted phosphodiesterase